MKELSIEEKAKWYDEALKVLHKYDGINIMFTQDLKEEMFPELREEYDDEKIRKELLAVINDLVLPDEQQSRFIAWLEKQGEHKKFRDSIQVGDKVTRNKDGVLVNLSQLKRIAKPAEKQGEKKSYASETMNEKGDFDSDFTRMMEKEQKPAWSEEDETKLNDAIDACKAQYGNMSYTADWLKSLKERVQPQPNHWKPSDSQMASITCAVRKMKESACYDSELVSLLNDLKKLKG